MLRITPALRTQIQELLLNMPGIDDSVFRRAVASNAGFPERLLKMLDWQKQPSALFVASLVEETLGWGTYSAQDDRHALVEYLRATREWSGGEHQRKLDGILESLEQENSSQVQIPARSPDTKIEWGEAPSIWVFYGRQEERERLEDWIQDRCRLVGLFGIGGIGKTLLASKLARDNVRKFDYVLWQSLRNAPPLTNILTEGIQFLSNHQEGGLPDDASDLMSKVIDYLRDYRCLLVLDNAETVMREDKIGHYREGYEDYGQFIRRIADSEHQSCLLVTSREKPREFGLLEAKSSPVRSLQLDGLPVSEGQQILEDKDLVGSDEDFGRLVHYCSGNPLVLNLVSAYIQEIYESQVALFLVKQQSVVSDVRDVLDEQFQRLPAFEQGIMYWLAIEREAVSLDDLRENIVHRSTGDLTEALRSLRNRYLVEQVAGEFTVQNVVMEYVTRRFIEQACDEIERESITRLHSHPVIKAQAREYVRRSQVRLILEPIAERLCTTLARRDIERRLGTILVKLREQPPHPPGYAAGTILNLLIYLKANLADFDFSGLTIKQADLQGAALHGTNFAHVHFESCNFTHTFGRILSVAYSPDGRQLAAGTVNGQVRVWHAEDGRPISIHEGHKDVVWSIAFSPDGHLLASGSIDQTVRLWDVESEECKDILCGHTNQVRSVAFSPDGRLLASGSGDHTVRLWSVGGECQQILKDHTDWVASVAFHPKGNILASGSEDATIRIWDTRTWDCIHILGAHEKRVRSIAFSSDGKWLASASDDQTVRVWRVATWDCVKTLGYRDGGFGYWSVAFSPDGCSIAASSIDGTVRQWDVDSGNPLPTLQGHTDWVRAIAFRPDSAARNSAIANHTTLASGSDDQTIRLWNFVTGDCIRILKGYANLIYALAFTHHDRILASGEENWGIQLWDVTEGQRILTFEDSANRVRSVAFSPNDTLLASGSEDQMVRIWDVVTGMCEETLEEHTHQVFAVAFNHHGDRMASGASDRRILIWDTETWELRRTLRGHTDRIRTVAFGPDDRYLASGGFDRLVRIWDLEAGGDQPDWTLEGHEDAVWSLAFYPQGRMLASGSEDATVRVWDIGTGNCLETIKEHDGAVLSVTFSHDGQMMASGGADCIVRLWQVSTWQCLKELKGHTRSVRSVVFSADGLILASSGDDEAIRIWDMQTSKADRVLITERPYEGMDITSASGLTDAQRATLKALGAVERL